MQQQDSKIFLIDKLLNSDRLGRSSRTNSVDSSSRSSRESSEKECSLPKEIMKQLEEKMLHNDMKRESFRARAGTSNFCLNPLFEEDRSLLPNESKEIQKPKEISPPEHSHNYSNEDSKSNCVENIFLDLNKVRRSGSLKDHRGSTSSLYSSRCNSLKRMERNLK